MFEMIDPASLRADFSYPTTIRFGPGRITELADACRQLGIDRPLLVTDPGLANLPMLGSILAANKSCALPTAVFTDFKPNPTGANVDSGVAAFRAGNHDGVIAVGGGSALDMGKAIAFMAGQTQPIWDFEDVGDYWKRAEDDRIAPIVAVPTTAGTGSEVGRAAVVLNETTEQKVIVFHPKMLPGIVISDPGLTIGLPPGLTAATGMDALAHCLEAFSAPGFHPLADGIAVEGTRLIKTWLPKAIANGSDLAARAHMLIAASMGAIAFQKGLGAVHALSHPVGALYDSHHGLTNAIFLPYVLAFNRDAIEDRLKRLAAYLDLPSASFESLLEWLLDLRQSTGIPHRLTEIGVGTDRIDAIIELALRDPSAGGNPVPLDAAGLRRILDAALTGQIEGVK